MEIILNNHEVAKIIKDYYKEVYSVKTCNVKITSEKIKDRLKEIDLFHNDQVYYNVLVKTKVSGTIVDKKGESNKFFEELDLEGTKDIVTAALSKNYEVTNVRCGVQFYNDSMSGQLEPKFTHMLLEVNRNDLVIRK